MKLILLQYQKVGITLFLHLDNALILADKYAWARTDSQRIVPLLWKLGFVLSLIKGKFKPMQLITYLGLTFNTREMTESLPLDKVLAIKSWATKETSYACEQGCNEAAETNDFFQDGSTVVCLALLKITHMYTCMHVDCCVQIIILNVCIYLSLCVLTYRYNGGAI